MSFSDWVKRLLGGSAETGDAEPPVMAGAPGVSGFADLESTEAAEAADAATDAPSDPAP